MKDDIKTCVYHPSCSGCLNWQDENSEILRRKKEQLLRGLQNLFLRLDSIEVVTLSDREVRDRMDFVIEEGRMGLWSHSLQKVIDLEQCLQLSPDLSRFYHDFRAIPWPLQKGSFRLRVGPGLPALRGAWLDFANQDVKTLLRDQTSLLRLMEMAHVEIGQKRKTLVKTEQGELKLRDPELQIWSQSRYQGHTIDLLSLVGGFTQVGHPWNQLITTFIETQVKELSIGRVLEYGSGHGNLSFPALGSAEFLAILETDKWALRGLQATAESLGIFDKIQILTPSSHADFKFDLVLLNPPRSGAFEFLKARGLNPSKNLIYMSCSLQSFLKDAELLKVQGYSPTRVTLLDQFPRTDHFEILSTWKLY